MGPWVLYQTTEERGKVFTLAELSQCGTGQTHWCGSEGWQRITYLWTMERLPTHQLGHNDRAPGVIFIKRWQGALTSSW